MELNSGGNTTEVGNATATDPSFTYTDVVAGTTYFFKVKAINVVGTSSDYTSIGIIAATVPAIPTALTRDEETTDTTQVSLTWTAPEDGGSKITGYFVELEKDGHLTVVGTTAATVTSFTYSADVTAG